MTKLSLQTFVNGLLIILILASCRVQVKTVYAPDKDFSKYKSYCWMTGCEFKFNGPAYLNDSLLRESLKTSIAEELAKKGLTQNNNNPDLLIGFTITVKDEQAVIYHRTDDTPVYVKPFDQGREIVNYLKGTLIVGMAEKQSGKMVWESSAVSYMELNPDFSEKNIHKGIKLVLRKYPPRNKD